MRCARLPGTTFAGLRAEPHRAAEIGLLAALLDRAVAVLPFGHQRDHRMRRVGVELGAVGVGEAATCARVLDHRELHAQADAEIRDLVLARVADRLDLAFDAALAEPARHEHRVHALQAIDAVALDRFGVDVVDVDPAARVDAGVRSALPTATCTTR